MITFNADGLDGHIDALAARELEDPLDRSAACGVDELSRAEPLRDPGPVLVEVDQS